MAEREGICLTSMMLLVGFGMSQYSSTTKADIFLSIGLLVGRECISIDYQPAPEVTRASTEIKGSDLPLEAKIMMYRCVDCGNLFEEGEQAVWEETHGLDYPPYEKWSGCPVCKGSYEVVYQCDGCGDWHTEEELYNGWCESCLRDSIDYDTFFEYCEANKEENYLDTFVMCYLLNCDEVPKHPSWDFHQLMIETYRHAVLDAKRFKGSFDFLPNCVEFALYDDGASGREKYAEWLNEKGVK